METKVKNREWVKDAAIVFLAVLLVLTFFSNTIMNRTLPEVATAQVTDGSIVAKVRGSGVVTANGKHQVKAKEIRTIRAVMIKAGQEVNAGDVLFVLGEGDATALEQAQETLRDLQFGYQRMAVSTPTFNYSSYYRAINNAETAYNRAVEKLDKLYEELQNQKKDPVMAAAWERYVAAKDNAEKLEEEYKKEAQTKREQLQAELQNLLDQLEAAQQVADSDPAVASALAAYDTALSEYENAQNAVADAQKTMDDAKEHYDMLAEADDSEGAPYSDYTAALAAYEQAKTAYENAVTAAQTYETNLQQATDNLEVARANAYAPVNSLQAAVDAKQAELDSWTDEAHYEAVKQAIELRDELYTEYAILAGTVAEDYQNAQYAAEDAANNVQAAYDDLYAAQQMNEQSVQASYVDLAQQAEKIKLQQEKIKSLAGDEENVITANVSGTVDTVDCTAGDTVLKDALLATIEVPDMGHTLSFSVTNDQAQRLRIGDTATISNYYWGNSITATLTTIRSDPKNPQTNKLLTFDLTGDVTTGAELTISVGQKSANYDLIVPNSAIKSDTNGSYVLAVSVKSSPLGNRYTARRVSVEVLANDDNNSAVVADLGNGDYVITTSSAPLNSGDMVRMADS